MAQQIINYGNVANDGTGDPLRDAFIKVDDNFTQIWAAGPVGSNITIQNNTIAVTDTNGNLILTPNGVGVIQTNSKILPRLDNTYDLGSATQRYRSAWVGQGGLKVSGDAVIDGNLTAGNISYTGNVFVGDLRGSVFADDSTILVDAVNSALYGYNITAGNSLSSKDLAVGEFGNTWTMNSSTLLAPSNAFWFSDVVTKDEYINSATDGYLNFRTFNSTANLASTVSIEHGLVHISFVDGVDYTWEFNNTGEFIAPGNVTLSGNVAGNYFVGTGTQLTSIANLAQNQGESVTVTGTRKTVSGDLVGATILGSSSAVVYTASSANVVALKMLLNVQHQGAVPGMEIMEVTVSRLASAIDFTVINRVTVGALPTGISATLNGAGIIEITATTNSGDTNYFTYDVTEFNAVTI